jgi:transcription elongation factor GreA
MEAKVKEVILTPEGHEKLKEEIEHLSTVKRREVAERIKQAREFGDINENSEYDDAKNEQAMLEHRIATLEERLKSARVIEAGETPKGIVAIGTRVRLRDIDAKETIEYHIVGSAEANPAEHKLSNESPVGKAIMGRKKGETVEVSAPRGSLKFKIMDVKAAWGFWPAVPPPGRARLRRGLATLGAGACARGPSPYWSVLSRARSLASLASAAPESLRRIGAAGRRAFAGLSPASPAQRRY